jgi:abhydrolase domain-containing protein 17
MKSNILKYFSFRSLLINAVSIYIIINTCAFLFSDMFIFYPQPTSYKDHQGIIKITTSDNVEISALYLPNRNARHAILFSHGNAEDIGDIHRIIMRLHDMGFSVFAYDYRGYGTSRGRPSETGLYRDIDAAWLYMTEKLSIPSDRIIVYGRSIGTGPSVELAEKRRIAGLILEAPFTSIYRVVTGVPILLFDKFENIRKIGNVRSPVLIIHGGKDELVPIRHGREIFERANKPKYHLWIANADHNNIDTADAGRYEKAITAFAKTINN